MNPSTGEVLRLVPLADASDVDADLARRQRGYGRGARMKIEQDRVAFRGGVRGGETLGGPIMLAIENRDHASWRERMPASARSGASVSSPWACAGARASVTSWTRRRPSPGSST